MLIAVISMLSDGVMTGAFLGDNAMAAYGLTNPVNMSDNYMVEGTEKQMKRYMRYLHMI